MAKKPATPATPKTISHSQAANLAVATIKGQTTLTALIETVERAVVESGGTANPKRAARHLRQALATAEALGLVRLTKPTDVLVAPAK